MVQSLVASENIFDMIHLFRQYHQYETDIIIQIKDTSTLNLLIF